MRSFLILVLLTGFCAQAVEVDATLDWANRQLAGFAVTGVVQTMTVAPGYIVKKNQVLAQLDLTPFKLHTKKQLALINGIKPRLFDAKQNFSQAQELYDRTVLSQVELQRAEVQYQGVEAEQAAARAEWELAIWQQQQAILRAPCECLVVNNQFLPGMVINHENQISTSIELVVPGLMNAELLLEKDLQLLLQQSVEVNVAGKKYPAKVIALQVANGKRVARVQFKYDASQKLYAGQQAKVIF